MKRWLCALAVVMLVIIPVRSQSVRGRSDLTSGRNSKAHPQSKKVENCACESQVLPAALAIVNGTRITRSNIEKVTREEVSQLQSQVIEARKVELDLQINSKLLAIEAKRRGVGAIKLLEQEVVAKVKEPTEAEAALFYDQNKTRIQADFKEVKEDILRHLLEQRQRTEAKGFAAGLRETIDTRVQASEATPPRSEADRARVLAIVNGERITSGDIEDSLQPVVADYRQRVYKLRRDELELSINDTLLSQEAGKRKITTSALLDVEIKPKTVTESDALAFYKQNTDRVSGEFPQTKDSIIRYLRQIEVRSSERSFIERLRAAASIQVFLVAPEPPVFSISTTDQPSLGNASARVTIVEFTDYQCPACAAIEPILQRLVKEDGMNVRLVARDFPLNQNAEAFKTAEAAEAAREQGKYWEYVEILRHNQSALGVPKLKDYATALNLDRVRFDKALDSGQFAEMVQRDVTEGLRLGVDATPAVFINGRRALDNSYDALKATIEDALKAPPIRRSPPRRHRRL